MSFALWSTSRLDVLSLYPSFVLSPPFVPECQCNLCWRHVEMHCKYAPVTRYLERHSADETSKLVSRSAHVSTLVKINTRTSQHACQQSLHAPREMSLSPDADGLLSPPFANRLLVCPSSLELVLSNSGLSCASHSSLPPSTSVGSELRLAEKFFLSLFVCDKAFGTSLSLSLSLSL